jgi:hypothetical protein
MRYVILHHTGWIADHFDLLLEADDAGPLHTWRLDRWPEPTRIEQLPDHRRIYLEYEGPVSGRRGSVRRVASGAYEVVERASDAHVVQLHDGTRLVLPLGA